MQIEFNETIDSVKKSDRIVCVWYKSERIDDTDRKEAFLEA